MGKFDDPPPRERPKPRRWKSLALNCERCGQEMLVERAGRYRDEDFVEYWHESQEEIAWLKREAARLLRALIRAELRAEALEAGQEANWTLYEAALVAGDELRSELLAQIRDKV